MLPSIIGIDFQWPTGQNTPMVCDNEIYIFTNDHQVGYGTKLDMVDFFDLLLKKCFSQNFSEMIENGYITILDYFYILNIKNCKPI